LALYVVERCEETMLSLDYKYLYQFWKFIHGMLGKQLLRPRFMMRFHSVYNSSIYFSTSDNSLEIDI